MENLREDNWKSSFERFHNSKYGIFRDIKSYIEKIITKTFFLLPFKFHRRKHCNNIWDPFRDWGSTPTAAPVPNLSLGDFAPEKTQSRISADGSRWVVTMDCRVGAQE